MEEFPQVKFDDQKISYFEDASHITRVPWKNLQRVVLETNDVGAFAPDIYWVLSWGEKKCAIPQGIQGEAELMSRLAQLKAFNSDAIILAMACAAEGEFLCWEKK